MRHLSVIALAVLGLLLTTRMWTLTPAIPPTDGLDPANPAAPGSAASPVSSSATNSATSSGRAPTPTNAPDEVQTLFEGLRAADLLHAETDLRIALPPADLPLAATWRNAPLPPGQARLVADLHHGAAGAALSGQVRQWNLTRRLTAIRDDGHALGVQRSVWRAYDCSDQRLLATGAPVPETFGYLHQGRLQLDLGDWTAVGTTTDCVEWRGELQAAKPLPLRVLFIGRPLSEPDGGLTRYDPARPPPPPDCAEPPPAGQAGDWHPRTDAWQANADGTWTLRPRLQLAPARNPGLAAPGLRIAVDRQCTPAWQFARARRTALPPARWQVDSADGQPLLTADAQPTETAEALGLSPIVGFGPHDHHGLGRRLQALHPGGHLRLTIDTQLQAAARHALTAGLARLDDNQHRRAVLVLLDLDGAIRAAASLPEPPPASRINPWDLAAFARLYPRADPRLVRAWEGGDRHTQPGSTLKPVTALAGLAAAEHDPQVAALLAGLSPAEFKRLTGLGLTATAIDPRAGRPDPRRGTRTTLKNFRLSDGRFETLGDLRRGQLAAGCPDQPPGRGDLGLPSALRDSLNIWFAALALQLDGAAADRFSDDPRPLAERPVPDLQFSTMLRRLGFGEPTALLGGGLRRPPHAERDRPDLFQLGTARMDPRWTLAQTSIGQGIQTTPLRMAAVAAAIARGAPVQPRLDARWNDHPVQPPPAKPLGLDLTLLHRGLRAVVQTGTAANAFKTIPASIRCHTYAKTGTAQIAVTDRSGRLEPYTSAWLIGWHSPAPGSAAPRDQPLAFACLVTHANAPGGSICGPIVAALLQALQVPAAK